jgi:hypothetical protein
VAGYQIHKATLEQTRYYLEHRLNIPIIIGNKNRIMAPDRDKSHSYWNAEENTGILFDVLENIAQKINKMSKHSMKNVKEIDVPLMSWYIHFACHYIVDAHTIWLINPNVLKYSKRLENMGELVRKKKELGANVIGFLSFENYKKNFITSIKCINETYKERSCKLFFPISWEFRQMVKEIVKYSSEFTIALTRLSWDNL